MTNELLCCGAPGAPGGIRGAGLPVSSGVNDRLDPAADALRGHSSPPSHFRGPQSGFPVQKGNIVAFSCQKGRENATGITWCTEKDKVYQAKRTRRPFPGTIGGATDAQCVQTRPPKPSG